MLNSGTKFLVGTFKKTFSENFMEIDRVGIADIIAVI